MREKVENAEISFSRISIGRLSARFWFFIRISDPLQEDLSASLRSVHKNRPVFRPDLSGI